MTPFVQLLFTVVFAGLLITAAVSDFRSYTIPNWISGALVAAFPAAVFFTPGEIAFAGHLFTALAVLAVGFVLFWRGMIGGGDVKLWAAVALWLGPQLIVPHVVLAGLLGGLLGVVLLIQRAATAKSHTQVLRTAVPYGIPIAVGALCLLPRIAVLGL